jgi:tight adherence protein B
MSRLIMVDLLAGSSIALVLVWFFTPRFFRLFDVCEMQRRLHGADFTREVAKSSHPSSRHQQREVSSELELAALCESLARATRSGASPHDALLTSLQQHHFQHQCWLILLDAVTAMQSCDSALSKARDSAQLHSNDAQCLSLLESAMVHGNFVPSALEHASSVLRDRAACSAELVVAASQAQLSARLLSMLPFVLLGGAILVSSQFRSSLWSPIVLCPLLIGVALNRIGWRWITSLIARAVHDEPNDIAQLTEHLCVSLRTGLSMTLACDRWRTVSPMGSSVAVLISAGAPLEEALLPLATTHPISGKNLGHTIVEAERDGLPILDTVMRLATDLRNERRRQLDTRIRQLPTRLSIPLVLCVLPSFLFLSVAPLVLASLSQLSISLPSVTQ